MQAKIKYSAIQSYVREYKRRYESANYYRKYEMNNPGDYLSTHCFDYYKCIFIHIPKTAGISISKTLFGNLSGSHHGITYYNQLFGKRTVEQYFKFAFVRNPWDRLYSAFTFLKKGGITENDARFSLENLSGVNSFEAFVLEWLNPESMLCYWHFVPQHRFLTSKKNRDLIQVDFIGRFEHLEEDFHRVCQQLKMPKKNLLHINDNRRKNKDSYTCYYNEQMIQRVAELYRKDIELFEYAFGE